MKAATLRLLARVQVAWMCSLWVLPLSSAVAYYAGLRLVPGAQERFDSPQDGYTEFQTWPEDVLAFAVPSLLFVMAVALVVRRYHLLAAGNRGAILPALASGVGWGYAWYIAVFGVLALVARVRLG